MSELTLEIDAKAKLGESPHWDQNKQLLYWVDIMSHKVNIYDPKTKQNKEINFQQLVSSVNTTRKGHLILTILDEVYLYDIDEQQLNYLGDPERSEPNNRLNDAKCDRQGRLWAGTMSLKNEKNKGALYRIDGLGNITKMFSPVQLSNGISWSPDHKQMYFIDSPTKKVIAFDYDEETGSIKNPQNIITITDGIPDGMTTDVEGNLWIAHWGGARVTRWNPVNGQLLKTVNIPVTNVTSCIFGGKHMNELFITTAQNNTNSVSHSAEPLAGGVFKLVTDTQGIESYKFAN